ncbi:chromate efflux transporter [Anaeromyxobacter terrae]|uniref:chromate efflux transporter n=1 Tax=Anaeromyxobacter terrae TaxID=2925406 RepID=UPI001F58EAB4|nr:chromate efflux transporter [Anaeromyxobacter sp. SG22]
MNPAPTSRRAALLEVARVFTRLGATAFGGPAAHVALMEDELVRRRGWVTRERFLDLLGAANLIPGPNSTELAIHLGYVRAGFPGLLVAGACFIVPAALMVGALAWAYARFGALPDVAAILAGVKPVVLVVVADALVRFARTVVLRPSFDARGKAGEAALVAVAIAATLLGANELLVLLGAGVLSALRVLRPPGLACVAAPALGAAATPLALATAPAAPATAAGLFAVFVKIGAVLYGSGYVLLAFLRADLVQRLGWLTDAQLLDAIAVGQVTPGPVFTTATFVGYLVAGPAGAAAATVGIFLPAFLLVALSGPLVPRLRASRGASAFLDGVNAASLALMAVVTFQLARDALASLPSVAIGAVAALLLVRYRVNSAWLVAGGAAAGWITAFVR